MGVQLPTDSCRLLLQVSYGCLWLPTGVPTVTLTLAGILHLQRGVYYKLNLGNVPLESSSGWSTRLTTSTALMFFFFYDPSLEGTLIMVGKSVMPCTHKHS